MAIQTFIFQMRILFCCYNSSSGYYFIYINESNLQIKIQTSNFSILKMLEAKI